MKNKPILEACVETIEQAIMAQTWGADRIEVCADLSVGGLTPSLSLIDEVKSLVDLPVMAMVRPRAGNFCYSTVELEEIESTIKELKKVDVKGVVFGFVNDSNLIDIDITKQMAQIASPLETTFHKAIDTTIDPLKSIEQLLNISCIHRVLSSGGCKTAWEGKEVLKEMKKRAGNELTVIAAGNITKENFGILHRTIDFTEYHGRRIVF